MVGAGGGLAVECAGRSRAPTADLEEDDAREDDGGIARDGEQLEHHDVGPLDDHEGARVHQEACLGLALALGLGLGLALRLGLGLGLALGLGLGLG